uniref:Cathepsin H n=1 Tax=Panthera tigris altaica TaxID=74533 RepID=A0A8C9M997_PANTA
PNLVFFFFFLSTEKVHFKSWMVQVSEPLFLWVFCFSFSFSVGLNQFSDMSFAEIKHKYLWSEPQNCSATRGNYLRGTGPYPPFVDWRTKGKYVSPVKNDADGATGVRQPSLTALAHRARPFLQAEQQLVDCAQNFNNHGCQGSLSRNSAELGSEPRPDGDCKFQPSKAIAFVKDVANITINDEEAMVEAVALYNPVSFAFEVTSDFMITSCHKTPDKVNHAVLAVGYGEKDGIPYWIVKNSWGPQWGMKGYFLIERGKNMCGLAACASYPIPLV